MSSTLSPSLRLFKIISDETRLRLLMILQNSEFTVGELVEVLGIHQSNISRQLTQLRDGALVSDRREGALVYYRWSDALRASSEIRSIVIKAWNSQPDSESVENHVRDLLTRRRQKSQEFFNKVAGRYRNLAAPGGGSEGLLRAFASMVAVGTAIDIGCGEGDASLLLARGCQRVVSVDLNDHMLDVLRERCSENHISNIEVRKGDMENLPLMDAEADLAWVSQVLHHAPSPESAICEMARVLKPGGRFFILDLFSHDQEWVREKLGDTWLGFSSEQLQEWLSRNNCHTTGSEIVHIDDGLPLLLLYGQKT
jgi:ArsR family transcriptional regulator